MTKEFDLAGMDSVGGWLRLKRKRVNIPVGTPCANCNTVLEGSFCHVCGQFAEDLHRSIFRLCFELIESIFHVDGRIWRTLPKLIFRPGVLTKDYLDGKRVPQIPPFRLFLVLLLTLFFVGHCAQSQNSTGGKVPLDLFNISSEPDLDKLLDSAENKLAKADKDSATKLAKARKEIPPELTKDFKAASGWMMERARAVQKDPERFLLLLEIWAYRVAVLALPMLAIMLSILFIFQRRFYVYDHLIYATHSLSAHLILLATILGLTLWVGASAWKLLLLSPFHVWFHMRTVYQTGIFGTLVRMALLGTGTAIGFGILAFIWLAIGFNAMA